GAHILPDKIHMLNVSFLVPQLRREFGGCAGNIAYNLRLLGDVGYPMATAGRDFGPYAEWMARTGVPTDHIKVVDSEHTAQAFITTDLDDNQITAFHPGAMNSSHLNVISAEIGSQLAIVAPDGREGMVSHIEQLARADIPFVFDPGQGLPMFSGAELLEMVGKARYVAVNDYEGQMLVEKTGRSLEELARGLEALIVTKGGEGSHIYTNGECLRIPCVPPAAVVDPTGCGDAYRAGLLYGIAQGYSWRQTGQLASLMGSLKIASRGGQNHVASRAQIATMYAQHFGTPL